MLHNHDYYILTVGLVDKVTQNRGFVLCQTLIRDTVDVKAPPFQCRNFRILFSVRQIAAAQAILQVERHFRMGRIILDIRGRSD